MGIHDLQFDSWIEARQAEPDKNVRTALEKSKTDPYYQMWKPTKEHIFPLQAPIPPSGHDQVKEEWKQMFAEGSFLFTKYLPCDRDKPPGRHVPYHCRHNRLNLSTYHRAQVRNL